MLKLFHILFLTPVKLAVILTPTETSQSHNTTSTSYENQLSLKMPSKFTEILDDSYRTTSPESDVQLEDLINGADWSRGRSSSEASSGSNSSSENLTSSPPVSDKRESKRFSKMFAKR